MMETVNHKGHEVHKGKTYPVDFILIHRSELRVLTPLPNPPERAYTEPAKQPGKTKSKNNAAGSRLTSVIFGVFAKASDHADHGQSQENKTCDFQPELSQDASAMGCGGARSFCRGLEGPGTAGLLRDYSGGDSGRHA
jgi:hypothetical protein